MRLIDADELKELIAANVYLICDAFNSRDYGMFWTGGIEKAIDEATTVVEIKYPITRVMVRGVEFIPVVRYKDCRYYNTTNCCDGCGWCERSGMDRGSWDNWFCADGVRKGGE